MPAEKISKSNEDLYFARLEFERKQKKLEEEHHKMKKAERDRLKKEHWMRCPKCGMEMVELEFEGIKIDKCSECLGIYLDNGELDELMEKKSGLLNRFGKLFK
jgi:uncharacterized protein